MPIPNQNLRARHGQKIPDTDVRKHCVSVRLTTDELALLDTKRAKSRRGEWLRMAAMDGIPQPVPEANAELALSLAKLLGALGSLMQNNKLDHAKEFLLLDIRSEVVKLREDLKGKK